MVIKGACLNPSKLILADASKTGAAQEAVQNAVRNAGKVINEQEARQILGVTEKTSWEEILQVKIFLFHHRGWLFLDLILKTLIRITKKSWCYVYVNAEIRQTVWE